MTEELLEDYKVEQLLQLKKKKDNSREYPHGITHSSALFLSPFFYQQPLKLKVHLRAPNKQLAH